MHARLRTVLAAALLCACACGGESKTSKSTDVLADAASAADGGVDVAADVQQVPLCKMVSPTDAAPDTTRAKFAVSIFHFNVEYVIGGLEYPAPDGTKKTFLNKAANVGWDNAKTEDYIVEQTFLPILEMYDKHPGWGVDLEMQAYMVEVIGERHPQVMDLLRKLAQRGQVELISFHYAAQFFLAFPKEDLHRSIQRTREIFAKYCLPLSGVVFNQEGQAGQGRQQMLLQEGYSVGVFPKNLWKYQHGEPKTGHWPLYSSEGGDLIIGGAGVDAASGVSLAWNFMDDGELRAVGKTSAGPYNPYFAADAPTDAARVAEFEQELANTEKAGYFMARVSDYVRHLHAKNIPAQPAPPLLDGTWQAPSTSSVHKWLGGRGIQPGVLTPGLGTDEADNAVRTGNMQARTDVAALQAMADSLAKQGKPVAGLEAALRAMWEDVWHAEVSDCTGINPWWGEIQFGLDRNAKVQSDAAAWRAKALTALGKPHADVNLQTGAVTPLDALPVIPALPAVAAPFEITVTAATGRSIDQKWQSLDANSYWLTIHVGASTCGDECTANELSVAFPRFDDNITYSPALIEDAVRSYPLSSFVFLHKETWLPLANGLIGLGKDLWVIKAMRTVHVAARISPDDAMIVFNDETLHDTGTATWQFLVYKGTAAGALQAADRLNLHPTVSY